MMSGAGAVAVVAPAAAHPDILVRHIGQRRLSFAGIAKDPVLSEIQDRLSPFLSLCEGWAGVAAGLDELAARGLRDVESLDLIDHSTEDNLLRLGCWRVGDDPAEVAAFARSARPALAVLRIGQVRLVGCHTAEGPAAQVAMRRLAAALGCAVLGTRTLVHEGHFDYRGCVFRGFEEAAPEDPQTALTSAVPIAAQLPTTTYDDPLDLGRLVEVTPSEPAPRWPRRVLDRERVQALLDAIDATTCWRMPGLQRAPTVELLVPAGAAQSPRCVQVLFGGALLRVFPKTGAARIYGPRAGSDALRALVAELLRP